MRSLTQYFLALMSILIVGTHQGPSSSQAPGILTNVLGLPSQQSTSSTYAANILWNWTIQLGSGTQAFSLSLNSIAAPIVNGTGVGELMFGSLSVFYAGSSIYISIPVTNATSSAISVTEIGLWSTVTLQYYSGGNYTNTSYNFLLSYDTFSTPVTVPGYSMAVFQITLTFTG